MIWPRILALARRTDWLERSNGRTIRTLRHERERPSDTGSGGLAARPILARNLMYCRRPDPAEVFHISVLALLMLFPLHRLVDRRTSLNADYSETSAVSVQTPKGSSKFQTDWCCETQSKDCGFSALLLRTLLLPCRASTLGVALTLRDGSGPATRAVSATT